MNAHVFWNNKAVTYVAVTYARVRQGLNVERAGFVDFSALNMKALTLLLDGGLVVFRSAPKTHILNS